MKLTGLLPIVFWGCAAALPAQKQHVDEAASTGTVSGRVFCADTNAPARMATVVLQPAEAVDAYTPEKQPATQSEGVQTLLDGSFAVSHVAPGNYYVLASAPGYVSPLASMFLPSGDRQEPGEPIGKRIAKVVPRITVQANLPVTVNVSLERGAAVSGTVLYDDGSPSSGLGVQLLVHWKDQWIPFPSTPFERENHFAVTDDQGAYRISGLPAMEYVLEVDLNLTKSTFSSNGMGGSGASTQHGLFHPGVLGKQNASKGRSALLPQARRREARRGHPDSHRQVAYCSWQHDREA
jgi:hypothetical protein